MMNKYFKIFEKVLIVIAVATIINIVIMYWFPIPMPISSFTAARTTFVAFIEKKYYLILISLFICSIMLHTAKSIKKNTILPAIILVIYYIYDLLFSPIKYFSESFYNIPIIINIYIIISLIIYLFLCIKQRIRNKKIDKNNQ